MKTKHLSTFAAVLALLLMPLLYGLEVAGAEEPDRTALVAFAQEPLQFDSFCFSGDRFPGCQFAHPERVEKLIGRYSLRTTWYDAQGKETTAPKKDAGRYAAVVEIQRPGRVSKRFFTLYHLQGNIPRLSLGAAGATLTLPRGTAIDPEIVQEQGGDIDALTSRALSNALKQDPAAAALLAGLHDLSQEKKPGKVQVAERASHRERQWWVDFKRRYSGYDKLHPAPFVCPRPVEGKPALVLREGTPSDAGMKSDVVAAIDAAGDAWVKENGTGFAMCVVRRGVVVVNKGYGQSQGKPVTAATPAVLASTTKFLNALLLLEMVDQGLIRLDDPVEKYIPALRGIPVKRAMTIRDLYLHTCGFSGHDGDTWPDLEEVVADMLPALEVGVRHQYQGMGHALASKIMEMMSGEALPYLYHNHLFAPLSCTSTHADYSAFGSSSTAIELARIGQMVLNGGAYGDKRFFSPETLAQMLPVSGKDRIGEDKSIRWGVGIKQMDNDGLSDKAFGHSGATGSFLVIDPARQLVLAHTRITEGGSYERFLKQKARFIAAILATIDTGEKR